MLPYLYNCEVVDRPFHAELVCNRDEMSAGIALPHGTDVVIAVHLGIIHQLQHYFLDVDHFSVNKMPLAVTFQVVQLHCMDVWEKRVVVSHLQHERRIKIPRRTDVCLLPEEKLATQFGFFPQHHHVVRCVQCGIKTWQQRQFETVVLVVTILTVAELLQVCDQCRELVCDKTRET